MYNVCTGCEVLNILEKSYEKYVALKQERDNLLERLEFSENINKDLYKSINTQNEHINRLLDIIKLQS